MKINREMKKLRMLNKVAFEEARKGYDYLIELKKGKYLIKHASCWELYEDGTEFEKMTKKDFERFKTEFIWEQQYQIVQLKQIADVKDICPWEGTDEL